MRKLVERIVAVCLAFAIVITAFTPVEAQAATKTVTKKLTMYAKETLNLDINSDDVVSIKSSKPSVVGAIKPYEGNCWLECKKAGNATVTIKTKKKTYKYVITAKKSCISTSLTKMSEGHVLLAITNNSTESFDGVSAHVFLKGKGSTIIRSNSYTIKNFPAGETIYQDVVYSSKYTPIMSQCKVTAVSTYKYLSADCKDVSSKMKVSVTDDSQEGQPDFTVKVTNPLKRNVICSVYIRLFDQDGNVVALYGLTDKIVSGKSEKYFSDFEDFSGVEYSSYNVTVITASYKGQDHFYTGIILKTV